MALSDTEIRVEIERHIEAATSVAPREVAQALVNGDEDWRKLLPRIRQQATVLYDEGKLHFIRKKKQVSPEGLKGVYRLAKAEN